MVRRQGPLVDDDQTLPQPPRDMGHLHTARSQALRCWAFFALGLDRSRRKRPGF